MGRPALTTVIAALQKTGYRTGRAMPGTRMPMIQLPVVAVALQKDEAEQQILAVTVLSPEAGGAAACEDVALEVAAVLREMGYICVQEHCQFDGKGDRFSVRILATWVDTPDMPAYSVSTELGLMKYVVNFEAEQKIDVQVVSGFGETEQAGFSVKAQPWTFVLEEQFPVDGKEPGEPNQPFTVVVRRGTIGEIYEGCYWTAIHHRNTEKGLHITRSGIAGKRSVVTYE